MVKKNTPARMRKKSPPQDSTAKFERLLRVADASQRFHLRLYVTGTTLRSSQAIANIRALCDEYLPGGYDLEVVDIYQQPGEAKEQQIIAAPTLIKQLPAPVRRLVGNLSDRDKVLVGLNLPKESKNTTWVKV